MQSKNLSVTPDPTGGSGAGIFTWTDRGVIHVDGGTLDVATSMFGAPQVVSAEYFNQVAALFGYVTGVLPAASK